MLFVKINKITTALFLIIALYTNSGLYAFTQNIYFKINAAPNDKSAYTFKLLKFENATFVLLDSAYAKSGSEIKFTANETSARLYKISIPNSGIKEVDFIVSPNEETLHISGTVEEFNTNSFLFSNSNENNCLQSVQNAQQYLKNAQDKNTELIQALDRFDSHKWRKFNLYDTILNSSIFSYNQALVNFSTIYPATYCGTNLIADLKFPSRFDTQEWRLQYDNDDAFLHDHFFDNFNFKDERILHFPYLFPSIFTYFKFYNYGTEEGYKNFIDLLLISSTIILIVLDIFNSSFFCQTIL